MTVLAALNPIPQFFDRNGQPLDGGYIYFGVAGQNPVTSPVTVYWDAAGTQPAAQPLRTINGSPARSGSPATPYVDGDYSLLVKDKRGRQVLYAPSSASATNDSTLLSLISSLTSDLASTVSALVGAGKVGFDWALNYAANTIGWGVRTAGNLPNALRYMPVTEWANILNGTTSTDLTTYVQQAVNAGPCFFPRGKWPVSATTGITLGNGAAIHGAGRSNTIFWALLGTGGSTAQKVAYSAGSVFKRAFTPGVANQYCGNWDLRDFAIILNHPTASITATAEQIGIDLRNAARCEVTRVHVGNIAPVGSFVSKAAPPGGYAQQGYGIVMGTVSSGAVDYCGGEVHNIVDCSAWGAYKGIVMDDLTLSPLSSAHAVRVEGCDIQSCHHLLVQEQQYTAGFKWIDNIVQDGVRRNGDASPTYAMRIAGYDNDVQAGYLEAGSVDYLLRFDSASDNNRVTLNHYSATTIGIGVVSDIGRRNRVQMRANTGLLPGGVDSKGLPIVWYDRAYLEIFAVTHYNGASMVLDDGFGVTVTRPTGAGDYVFTFDIPFISANCYTPEVSYDTNASGHGGTHAVISHTASNVRIQFYAQNGATTTAIDPRFVFVRFKQNAS